MTKCVKHRRKAIYKWRICSVGPWEGVCAQCDLDLNRMALKWRYPKTWQRRYKAYEKKVRGE